MLFRNSATPFAGDKEFVEKLLRLMGDRPRRTYVTRGEAELARKASLMSDHLLDTEPQQKV